MTRFSNACERCKHLSKVQYVLPLKIDVDEHLNTHKKRAIRKKENESKWPIAIKYITTKTCYVS